MDQVKRWCLTILGGTVALSAGGYAMIVASHSLSGAIEAALAMVLALIVTYVGWQLARQSVPPRRIAKITRWTVTGGIVAFAIVAIILGAESLGASTVDNPIAVLFDGVAVGLLGGVAVGVSNDHTHVRARQLAEQHNRLEEFAGIVAHDLRNPLAIAKGQLELARRTGDEQHFEAVEQSFTRMERLTREVLALSRSDATTDSLERIAIETAARRGFEAIETENASLAVETDRVVEADPQRLQTLLENLFRNSIEHGGATTITIRDLSDGIAVLDDGSGIPEDKHERVFEGGYSTADAPGFGLAIVRQIAEAHDWHHEFVEADENEGARFELRGMD